MPGNCSKLIRECLFCFRLFYYICRLLCLLFSLISPPEVTKLLQTRNIFVMTDDGDWLNKEIATVDPEWKIAVLAGRRFADSRAGENEQRETQTEFGERFFSEHLISVLAVFCLASEKSAVHLLSCTWCLDELVSPFQLNKKSIQSTHYSPITLPHSLSMVPLREPSALFHVSLFSQGSTFWRQSNCPVAVPPLSATGDPPSHSWSSTRCACSMQTWWASARACDIGGFG